MPVAEGIKSKTQRFAAKLCASAILSTYSTRQIFITGHISKDLNTGKDFFIYTC